MSSPDPAEVTRHLYLDLMMRSLLDYLYGDQRFAGCEDRARIGEFGLPAIAHTMIGIDRLKTILACLEDVIGNRVPGDLIETGVWRGGACIFMRAILKAHGILDRRVWVADSFRGLPVPDESKYPYDTGLDFSGYEEVAVSLGEVKKNFERYGLLDECVQFLPGWFKDTLPDAPIDRLAVLRLDGDLYESTTNALESLYPKLSIGGYVVVDDYGVLVACRQAVHDFRDAHGIHDEITWVDESEIFWKRSS